MSSCPLCVAIPPPSPLPYLQINAFQPRVLKHISRGAGKRCIMVVKYHIIIRCVQLFWYTFGTCMFVSSWILLFLISTISTTLPLVFLITAK